MVKDFPLSPIEKILKKAGQEVGADRVSSSALQEMKNTLIEISDKIAVEAVAACKHAKRVTVKREDIVMATR